MGLRPEEGRGVKEEAWKGQRQGSGWRKGGEARIGDARGGCREHKGRGPGL